MLSALITCRVFRVLLPKIVIVTLLVAIVASLFSSAFFLVKDDSHRRRVLNLLKLRVALSVVLLIVVLTSFSMGWLVPSPSP